MRLSRYRSVLLVVLVLLVRPGWASEASTVYVGLKIEQIASIDQKQENFTVVARLRVNWQVPQLAFTPGPDESGYRTYTLPTIRQLLEKRNLRWPAVTFANQQGRTAVENQIVQLDSNGTVKYFQRFTATFQAPYLDFRLFPLDKQRFHIHVDSIFPLEDFVFEELPGYSGMGRRLGEEEWVVTAVDTRVTEQAESGFDTGARYTLEFRAKRHLNYYVMRILIPIALIITVSWVTFFLQDYAKRVDLAGANLLLFIAFNFTVSNDIPRLGYVTLIDAIMVGTFVITSLVILVNVVLRRLESHDKVALARRLDVYAIVGYPVAYMVGITALVVWFT